MPSLVDRPRLTSVGARRALEWALRLVALAAIAVLLWRATRPMVRPALAVAASGGAREALARWSTVDAPDTLHARFATLPARDERDWLRALAGAGSAVRWSTERAVPLAVIAERVVAPRGGVRVRLAGPARTHLALADEGGPIDTLTAGAAGASATLVAPAGVVRVSAGGTQAVSPMAESVAVRRVLVLGAAGWEAKFVIDALEEDGWTVDARLPIAPGVVVTQGAPPAAVDTARYAVVVVLDSTAAPFAERVGRFARTGGGVVLAGVAARLSALAALAPGGVAERVPGVAGALTGAEPRRGLAVRPVARLKADAVPLERRGALVTAAARRAELGRVVQLGYDETWRWRMLGGEDGAAAHRAWWSRVVASAAYAPVARGGDAPGGVGMVMPSRTASSNVSMGGDPDARPRATPLAAARRTADSPTAVSPDPAPYAAAVAGLGRPRPAPRDADTGEGASLPAWLFLLIATVLLAEWGSRRLRGAR